MSNDSDKKNNGWRRSLIEYLVIGGIVLLLYTTGYYVEVIGRLQQLILWSGIIQPDIEQPIRERTMATMDMPLISLSGKQTNLKGYRGKVIFINFWATWCPPCVAEMPDIHSLYQKYTGSPEIVFLMVSLDQNVKKAQNFIKRKGFTFPVFMPLGTIPEILHSEVVPTTFVINQNGKIVFQRNGMAQYNTDQFRAFLDSLAGISK